MICPNCDNVINATGCQSCGWKVGDPWPAHRLDPGSSHLMKSGNVYPPRTGVKAVPHVIGDSGFKGMAAHATLSGPRPVDELPVEPITEGKVGAEDESKPAAVAIEPVARPAIELARNPPATTTKLDVPPIPDPLKTTVQ